MSSYLQYLNGRERYKSLGRGHKDVEVLRAALAELAVAFPCLPATSAYLDRLLMLPASKFSCSQLVMVE